ncbi:peptidase MA family protein [Leptospira yanagawae serovar Saopaulo str. Sao Paulo = ATCC 700523]|uniref:Peptidase MA family protein n=1 Tax=Leptospira yanagawae serovar Saopaulo str. Sao Paulo = ATCC 700523 TaxID=1249483 RepID=A0A5E8H8P7_9LEPT|nr:peptidase MA [Leptospira yanagawae]EOQ87097.1 peptidase MA family protein [Leptospira yanagawae serovar Saopaulo str. Sao Paulo = ATCC 700523]
MHLNYRVIAALLFISSIFFNCYPLLLATKEEPNDNSSVLLGTYLLLVGNCNSGNGLWARDLTTQTSVCVPVQLLYDGNNVQVYKEVSLSTNYDLVNFGKVFDTNTYSKLIATFGTPSDRDGDGKIKILVMDIRDGATANSPYVAGYYDPVNYFSDNFLSRIRSNFAEVLYLDGKELIAANNSDPTAFTSTAAHEFQHLLRFPRMYEVGQTDELWINEGTSEVASDIAGFGPQTSRLDCYAGRESRCSDGINGVSLLDWNNSSSEVLKQYAFAYVFLKYLYESSGTTEAQKQSFFRNSVLGVNGIRANSTGSLMSVFQTSANFQSSALTTQNSDIFFRMYTLITGYSFGLTNFSSVEQVQIDGGNINTIDLSNAVHYYPLPTSLNRFNTLANQVTPTTIKNTIKQGSTNFYNTAPPNILVSSSRKNYGRVAGIGKGIFLWADSPSGFNASFRNVTETEETFAPVRTKPRSLKSVIGTDHGHQFPICGFEFTNGLVHTSESIPIE